MTLKVNSKAVLDIVASQKKKNATQAYLEVHPDASKITAMTNAYKLMAKPEAQIYLEEHISRARTRIVELVESKKEEVALNASKDILDREYGRATQRVEQTTTGVTLTIDLTSALSVDT